MSARRTTMYRLQELVRLHRMGSGPREVASFLKMSPNTERRYRRALTEAGLLAGDPNELPELDTLLEAMDRYRPSKTAPQEVSSAAPWQSQIEDMMLKGAQPLPIFNTLSREESGFTASRWAVKRLWRRLKDEQGVRAEDVAIRVNTPPGHEAQVDFGFVGKLYDPVQGVDRKAWVFVMTLSYSRHQFCRVVFDQSSETWIQLHILAFESFGGVPAVVRPDNLKAAVIKAAFGAGNEAVLNRSYRELARYYGFKIDPTPPYQPQKKGKVESGVKYVKGNFFKPLQGEFADIDDTNTRLESWVTETAGIRVHGTTRWQPLVEFTAEELPNLTGLPAQPYQLITWKKAKIHSDSHFLFERRTYPVPWRFLGKTAWIRALPKSLEVYIDDARIITHERGVDVPDALLDRCLPKERRDYRQRGREFWEKRADAIDLVVGKYIREVFESDRELSKLRAVQALVSLLEKHPVERAVAACRRASFYGCYSYRGVRDILRKGLDLHPLPTAISPAHGSLKTPKYARSAAELLQLPLESINEPH